MNDQQNKTTAPYTRRDWQFWALLPLLAVMAAAGAAYQIGVNIKAWMSST